MSVVCTSCGWHGEKPGYGCAQVGLTIFLALFFLIPGILFAIYADSQRKNCPSCGNKTLIPESSPMAANVTRMTADQMPPPRHTKSSGSDVAIAILIPAFLVGALIVGAKSCGEKQEPVVSAEVRPALPTESATPGASNNEDLALAALETSEPAPIATVTETVAPTPAPATPAVARDAEWERERARSRAMRDRVTVRLDTENRVIHAQTCPNAVIFAPASLSKASLALYQKHSCMPAE